MVVILRVNARRAFSNVSHPAWQNLDSGARLSRLFAETKDCQDGTKKRSQGLYGQALFGASVSKLLLAVGGL